MRTHSLLIPSALAFLMLGACGSEETTNPDPSPSDQQVAKSDLQREENPAIGDDAKAKLVDGHNAFAFDMFDLIRQDEGAGKNMFFSPTSMTIALSMAYAGARGSSATEMAAALHYTLPPEDLFASFNWLDQTLEGRDDFAFERARSEAEMYGEKLPSRDDFRLHVVNSIWGERTMTFEQPFLDTLAVNYGAGVFLSDFKGNPDVERVRINDWVAEETLDRIQDLIPEGAIDGGTRSVLVNAIHLKMPWDKPFDKADDLTFTRPDGTSVAAPAIMKSELWQYAEADGVQAVRIPLEGAQVELVVVAPPAGGLDAFEAGLTNESFQTLFDGMQIHQVNFRMPKVNFTTDSIQLRPKLETLGMSAPFSPESADFSGITTDEPLFISDVIHKAMLGIDENGVEAAAATAVILAGSGMPPEPVDFHVDRPFFVAIVDAPTDTILFAGHIVDPTSE